MSPQRDPRTGQFVSGGGGGHLEDLRADLDTVTGSKAYAIPAADLAGGLTNAEVDGEEAEIIDFTGVLDDDEFFRIRLMRLTIVLDLFTTASAEGNARMAWALRTDFDGSRPARNAVNFDIVQPSQEQGIVDIVTDQEEESSLILSGVLSAEASFNDGVGNSGGADIDRERVWLRPATDLGAELVVDEDDEITLPVIFEIENVSDHRVSAGAVLTCYGNEVRQE